MNENELGLDELDSVSGGKKKKKPVGTSRADCPYCGWVDIPNDQIEQWIGRCPITPCPKCGQITLFWDFE